MTKTLLKCRCEECLTCIISALSYSYSNKYHFICQSEGLRGVTRAKKFNTGIYSHAMQGSLNAVLMVVVQVVCTFTVVRAHRSHSHPQANANAGLKAPIFQMSDLVGTKGVFTVTPKNFTFGVTYNLGYSMPVADTVLSVHPLPACTTFAAHWHPYADETSIVIEGGPLNVGWMFVNSTYSASNISLGQVAVFPIGITHFLSNQNCWNSKYVVSFNSAQGGTIPVTHSVALMPQSLQEGFLGGDSYKIKDVKRLGLTYEDPECVKRCQRSQDGLA